MSLIELRKSVGMVFQRPNPLPLSVYENVVFGMRLHHERRQLKRAVLDEAVEKALTEVGLWDDLKDRLDTPRHRPAARAAAEAVHRPARCRSSPRSS